MTVEEGGLFLMHFIVNSVAVIGIWLALMIVHKFPRSHRIPLTFLAVGKIIEVLGESAGMPDMILIGRTIEDGALCLLSILLINYWLRRKNNEDKESV